VGGDGGGVHDFREPGQGRIASEVVAADQGLDRRRWRRWALGGARLIGYLAYALTVALGIPAAILLLLLVAPRRGRRLPVA